MKSTETTRAEASAPTLNSVIGQHKSARYYLDITIPAALNRGIVVGHTLVICSYPRLRNHFLDLLEKKLQPRRIRKDGQTNSKYDMGALFAHFTSLSENDFCLQNLKSIPTDPSSAEQVRTSLSEFYVDIVLGKGMSARTARLDLPAFTLIAVVDDISQIPQMYLPLFENVINFNDLEQSELCVVEVNEVARQLGLDLETTASRVIAAQAQGNLRLAASFVRRISDFLLVKNEAYEKITESTVRDIISRFM